MIARYGLFVAMVLPVLHACANDVAADEDEPFDDRSNELDQGMYDCSERNDTGYRNGSSFPIKVVSVDGKPVQVDTANSYIAMQAKAKRDGINLRIVSGFRTMAEQQYLYGCYIHGNCNGGNLAAVPGHSNHQSGHAADLNTSDAGVYSWLENHGHEFGWARTVPSEIWHWEWWGNHSDYPGPCGGPQLPPKCESGNFHGDFCDDDGHGDEQSHDRLKSDLGVNFHCQDMNGHPAFCGDKDATRADTIFVFGAAAHMPLSGHPDAFVDDNNNPREKYFDAAKDYGILHGYAGRKVKPTAVATRDQLAVIMSRMYDLPKTTHDYFYDDDGDANEAAHNEVAAAGLMLGYADAHHTRRKFDGSAKANRDTLATLAWRAHENNDLVAVWNIPAPCKSGNFTGHYCDDDARSDETIIDRLAGELGVPWTCRELAGQPAFCAGDQVSRAEAMYALGKAAQIPVGNDPDGFRDDDNNPREKYLNAAKVWGILVGFNGGKDVKPNDIADRDTLAIMLARIYALPAPPAGTPDAFSDDNGSSMAPWHNKVAWAGLFNGIDDGHGGRKFDGKSPGTKAMVAALAGRAKDHGLVPVWLQTTIAPAPAPSTDDPPPAGSPPANDDTPGFGDDPAPGDGPVLDDGDATPGDDGDGVLLAPVTPVDDSEGARPPVPASCASVDVDTTGLGAASLAVSLVLVARRRRAR